ncbi:MAG: hypothetical protein H6581_12220 [Bacteroidia bacterium]|nr:hypothetical protein [Bacteroidia bacterium]
MKPTQFFIHTAPCNCQSQHLICPGETCENCMGVVDHSLPDASTKAGIWFDETYFEELEARLEAA